MCFAAAEVPSRGLVSLWRFSGLRGLGRLVVMGVFDPGSGRLVGAAMVRVVMIERLAEDGDVKGYIFPQRSCLIELHECRLMTILINPEIEIQRDGIEGKIRLESKSSRSSRSLTRGRWT